MINNLKKKFLEIGKILIETEKLKLNQKNLQGLLVLSNLKFQNIYLPINSFSLNSNAIVDILNDILLNNRKTILEFGSGLGTLYIAKLIQKHNLNIKFVSVDSDEEWIAFLNVLLEKEKLSQYVILEKAEVKDLEFNTYRNQNKWYDTKVVTQIAKNLNSIDMIIVDGPYGQICDYVRYSAIPILKNYLSEEYYVFLDDTNRDKEKLIFKEWEDLLEFEGSFHDNYSKIVKGGKFKTQL